MHPYFYALTRLQLRRALRAKGLGFSAINTAMEDTDNGLIDAATSEAAVPEDVAGAHPVLDAIIAFLTGPGGQALIGILLKLLGL